MPNIKKLMRQAKGTKREKGSKLTKDVKKAVKHFMTHKHGDFLEIALKDLQADPDQPRKEFDTSKLKDLAESIENKGVLQPILVRLADNNFWIVAGERRYRAAKIAGLDDVPCIITTGDPDEISLVENIQREDLTPVELSNGVSKIMAKHGYNQSQVAKIIGKSRNTVSAIMAVNRLPKNIRDDLSRVRDKGDGVMPISRRTLVEIAKEPPEKAQKLYDAAKKGATSDQIRQKRTQTTNKSSADEILSRKIQAVKKSIDGIENHKRLKRPVVKELRELRDTLISFLS